MMTQDYTPAQAQAQLTTFSAGSIEQALGEVERELGVRVRCYDKWVAEGKMSKLEAKERKERLTMARDMLYLISKLRASSDEDSAF
jgi:hypothetical protein